MKVETKCKFCQKPITLSIDDTYAEMGDPYKLVRLGACNRCADYRTARRRIFERLHQRAMELFGGAVAKEDLPKSREALTSLIKKYMRLFSDHNNLPMPDWDEAIVDGIMDKPGNYSVILALVPKMFQQPSLV